MPRRISGVGGDISEDEAHPDRAPRKLPGPDERMIAPRLLPDGKTLVFLSDVGSDQKFHVFRIGLDGSGLADLTPTGELLRMAPHVARRSGAFIYGAHTLADPRYGRPGRWC